MPVEHPGTAVTIGNFDGCHRGHRQLIQWTVEQALARDLNSVAISFRPRPEAFFRGLANEPLLFTTTQKTRALGDLGVQCHRIMRFHARLSEMNHADFFEQILVDELQIRALCVGQDFRFGAGRHGDIAYLQQACEQFQVKLNIESPLLYEDLPISSSRIRTGLARNGSVEAVTDMLGRPYLLEAEIEKGDRIGTGIGFPTANMKISDQLIPHNGVYAGYSVLVPPGAPLPDVLDVDKRAVPAVINIGVRPTVSHQLLRRVEVHAYEQDWGDTYGQKMGFYFVSRLRGEQKFSSVEALKQQIAIDIGTAKQRLAAE